MKSVKMYTTFTCPYCTRAKQLLESLGIDYEEIDLSSNLEVRDEMMRKHNWQSVPMITIGDEFIGGYDDLSRLHSEGQLKEKVGVKNEM